VSDKLNIAIAVIPHRRPGLNARSSNCAVERYPSAGAKNPVPSTGFFFPCRSTKAPLSSQHQLTLFNFNSFAHAN
jgi:hypothetical protein